MSVKTINTITYDRGCYTTN